MCFHTLTRHIVTLDLDTRSLTNFINVCVCPNTSTFWEIHKSQTPGATPIPAHVGFACLLVEILSGKTKYFSTGCSFRFALEFGPKCHIATCLGNTT